MRDVEANVRALREYAGPGPLRDTLVTLMREVNALELRILQLEDEQRPESETPDPGGDVEHIHLESGRNHRSH